MGQSTSGITPVLTESGVLYRAPIATAVDGIIAVGVRGIVQVAT
jgi:hypothetical protein